MTSDGDSFNDLRRSSAHILSTIWNLKLHRLIWMIHNLCHITRWSSLYDASWVVFQPDLCGIDHLSRNFWGFQSKRSKVKVICLQMCGEGIHIATVWRQGSLLNKDKTDCRSSPPQSRLAIRLHRSTCL